MRGASASSGLFGLCKAEVDEVPFRHFVLPEFMSLSAAESLLHWFETEAEWKSHVEDGFYECFNLDLKAVELPKTLAFLTDQAMTSELRQWMGEAFSVPLGSEIDVAAHKLVPPQRMGVHTDFGPIGQTHRLLVQLNRGWTPQNGGLLMMFDEPEPGEPSDRHRYYLPSNRSGIGFEISSRSFHAITPVAEGERYTLCFSFYAE